MAISLGFGVLFVTVIALVLVPCVYLALEDGERAVRRWKERLAGTGGEAVGYPRPP